MIWEKPEFTELKMDAEIGSYQGDDPGEDGAPIVARQRSERSERSDDSNENGG